MIAGRAAGQAGTAGARAAGDRIAAAAYVALVAIALVTGRLGPLAAALTFFFAPGYFLALRLAAGRLPGVALLALGLVLSPAIATATLLPVVSLAGASLATARVVLFALGAGLALEALRAGGGFPRRHAADESVTAATPLDRSFWAGLALLAALALPLAAADVQLSFHGLYHLSIVHAILNGAVPPPNPGYHGGPIDTYWAFHLFLAAAAPGIGISPLVVSTVLRAASLLAVFLLLGVLARRVGGGVSPWAVALFALFCINLLGPLLVLTDFEGRLAEWLAGGYPQPHWLGSAMPLGDARAANGLAKFLNFNAFSYALAVWTAGLLMVATPALAAVPRGLLLAFLGIAAITFHLPTAPALLVVAPLAFALAGARRNDPARARLVRLLAAGVPSLVALLLTSPYWYAILVGFQEAASGGAGFAWPPRLLLGNLATLLGAFLLLLPFLAHGAVRPRPGTEAAVLRWVAAGTLLLGLVLVLPGANQYKFFLLAAFPVGIVAADAAASAFRRPRLRRAILALGLGLAVVSAATASVGYLRSRWWVRPFYQHEGTALANRGTDAYAFLRRQTPREAVALERPVAVDASLIGAVGERQSFFRLSPWGYYDALPGYAGRAALLSALFTPGTDRAPILRQVQEDAAVPVYIVLERRHLGPLFEALLDDFAREPTLCSLFRDDGGAVLGVGAACSRVRRHGPLTAGTVKTGGRLRTVP
ncbi:MAG: hypothetical protein KY466_06895 [Gemmatimonadetes bacterium]|nr:hypothetical protein [Gemmatimonadota bacterium]